ncbi:MAG TPA: glucose-1-phosphate adenylyltransferase, partial [Calditrichae bacterium]|nr:glucose-1-phosphate adenylyltransferase [Calditrichia bacterium]
MKPYRVVSLILAGGQGSRLYPLTKLRSKPAVPIGGKYRLVDVTISNCLHSGFRQIFIITQFAAESLHRHIFSTYRFDNFTKDFVTILSAQQTLENRNWYQGTADAVRQNLRFIRKYGDYVLILSGDHLYRMDYRQLVEYHIEKNADITISTIPVKEEEAFQLGILQASPDGEIHAFVEKPTEPDVLHSLRTPEQAFRQFGIEAGGRSYLASMGIYVFKREVLFDLLANTTDQDFGKDVIPSAIKTHRVFAYMFDGYWEDIGTIRSFYEAHMQLVDYEPRFDFYNEERPIYTHPRFLPPVKLLDAEVNNAILGDGAIV